MKLLLSFTLLLCLIISFYSCKDTVTGGDDTLDKDTLPGFLDSTNAGPNRLIVGSNLDSALADIFATLPLKNGLTTYYTLKNMDLSREIVDTNNWDTTIAVDSVFQGKTGALEFTGNSMITKYFKSEDDVSNERVSSVVNTQEILQNYTIDSLLFFGGELITSETKNDTLYYSSLVAFWKKELIEVCSLNIGFNGSYQGRIKGTVRWHLLENSDFIIDSTVVADLSLSSGNTIIKIEKEQLEKYLRN